MSIHIQRREFITLIGVAAAWPLAARAQQSAMPVIGFLDAGSAAERTTQVAAFRKGLAEGGYHVGQNVALEFHWAEGQYERFPELAADFVRRKVSVIVTPGSATAALAAKAATSTIPIVFGAGGDPVKQGLVASFNRPGGNLTGVNFFTAELVAKRMQLLRELVPAAKRVAVLVNPTDLEGLRNAARRRGGGRRTANSGSRGHLRPRHRCRVRQHDARERRRCFGRPRHVLQYPARSAGDPGGAPRAAGDLSGPRLCRGWRLDELRKQSD